MLILAILRQGKGAWSQTAFYSTAASVPSAPENLKTACSGASDASVVGKLLLEWDTPCSNGATILGYVLELQDVRQGSAYELIYNGPETRFSVGGLMAGNTYKFRVKASNEVGSGEYSAVLEATGQCLNIYI